jgi:hypothetical protein
LPDCSKVAVLLYIPSGKCTRVPISLHPQYLFIRLFCESGIVFETRSCSVCQAGLELSPPVLASQILRFQACATIPNFIRLLNCSHTVPQCGFDLHSLIILIDYLYTFSLKKWLFRSFVYILSLLVGCKFI